MSTEKEKLRRAFPVSGSVSKEKLPSPEEVAMKAKEVEDERPGATTGIRLMRRSKIPMSTLTIRYSMEMEERLEAIARHAGLNKTEVVLSLFEQTFPELEKQFGIEK